jgi:heme/copper-type cytochrome/quinol oxidase subunit 1
MRTREVFTAGMVTIARAHFVASTEIIAVPAGIELSNS